MERSLAVGDATTPGPPRGITLNRQNSIGAGGSSSAAAPDRCRLRQIVAPIPAASPAAITAPSPATGTLDPRDVDDNKTRTERVSSRLTVKQN